MGILAHLTLYIHLFTLHFHHLDTFNYNTFGAGVSYKEKINVGYYKNSIYKDTLYATYRFDNNIVIGIATGYPDKTKVKKYVFKPIFPNKYGLMPIIAYDYKVSKNFHLIISPIYVSTVISF